MLGASVVRWQPSAVDSGGSYQLSGRQKAWALLKLRAEWERDMIWPVILATDMSKILISVRNLNTHTPTNTRTHTFA